MRAVGAAFFAMVLAVLGFAAPAAFAKTAASTATVGGAVAPEGGVAPAVAPEIEPAVVPTVPPAVPTVPTVSPSTEVPVVPVTPTPAKRTKPVKRAPVVARKAKLAKYKGPVYEKDSEGELVPYVSAASKLEAESTTESDTGGIAVDASLIEPETPAMPELLVPGRTARLVENLAAAPIEAPEAVQEMIWAANKIVGLPYIYGGGHGSFVSPGYDCSGTVSFALHGASLLKTPEDSSEFEDFGKSGVGSWVTIFSNPGHAYMDVAGLRLDTSAADDPGGEDGPRWRPLRTSNAGYRVRHPNNL